MDNSPPAPILRNESTTMPYCGNCGQHHATAKNYCQACGEPLDHTRYPGRVEVANLGEGVATGVERAHWSIQRRQSTIDVSNDSLELYLKFVMIIALFQGLAYMLGGSTMTILNGNLGLVLYGGVFIGAIAKILLDVRLGYSLGRSLLEVVFIGVFAYGLVFGVFWWLTENYLHAGKPLLDFSSLRSR